MVSSIEWIVVNQAANGSVQLFRRCVVFYYLVSGGANFK